MTQKYLHSNVEKLVFLLVVALALMASTRFFADPWASEESNIILLATTTSTENSGLLDYLLPYMEEDTGYSVRTIAAGTGKSLKMGQAGDVDVLLVHAKQSELEFIEVGYGINRRQIMFNDFVIVGPIDDPASIHSLSNLKQVFTQIAIGQVAFISRGDDSGTHKKERNIWHSVGVEPTGDWYREVGQGMGKTLQTANELNSYTLTDRGTWIFSEENLSMGIVFEGDKELQNQYSVIAINPELHNTNYRGATVFSDWMTSKRGQQLINSYHINGKQLFYANAD